MLGCHQSIQSDCEARALSCSDVPSGQMCPAHCEEPHWQPGSCEPGEGRRQAFAGQKHIEVGEPITYSEDPPASGNHRPRWACWGEYAYLSPTRWLHNAEHGGIVFLYHPCASNTLVEKIRAFVRAQPIDDGGEFRWIMTPYSGLDTAMAAVSWEWVYKANCFREEELADFVRSRYRQAPEDLGAEGFFSDGFLGR